MLGRERSSLKLTFAISAGKRIPDFRLMVLALGRKPRGKDTSDRRQYSILASGGDALRRRIHKRPQFAAEALVERADGPSITNGLNLDIAAGPKFYRHRM